MASRDRDNSVDDEDEDTRKNAPKQRSDLIRIVIPGAIALFLAILGAQVTAPIVNDMISGGKGGSETSADHEERADAAVDGSVQVAALAPAMYTPLDPPMVVSFADSDGNTRFVQLTLQAMARSEKAINAVKQHAPAIRNAFLFQLSARQIDELMSLEGKEKLRAEMTAKAQEILETNAGDPSIEELYFTSFVIQ